MVASLLLILAPIPAPAPVAEAEMVGTWRYEGWCNCRGVITLLADGSMAGFDMGHDGQPSLCYAGRWWIDRDGSLRLACQFQYGRSVYPFRLSRMGARTMRATAPDRSVAVFSWQE